MVVRRVTGLLGAAAIAAAVGLFASCSDDAAESPTTSAGGQAGSGGATGGAGGEAGAGVEPFVIDGQRMHDDVAWLAHPDRTGRAPATAGGEAALDYVAALFEDLGLVPKGDGDAFRHNFPFEVWFQTEEPVAVLDGQTLTRITDYSNPVGDFITLQHSGTVDVTAEIVFVGYGITVPAFDTAQYPQCPLDSGGFDEYAGVDVTDKIALALRHGPDDDQAIYDHCPGGAACVAEPCTWNFGYKVSNARLHGAAATIIVQNYVSSGEPLLGATIGAEYYHADQAAIFVARGTVETALPNLQTWADAIDTGDAPNSQATGVTATVTVTSTVQTGQTDNLLAAVEGTDPDLRDEVIVVGAHIDHLGTDPDTGDMYPGADDNASGTAVVMELARAMAHGEIEPARTVLFASWNAEEIGLVGSCRYVEDPVYPLGDTIAAFSLDMVGDGDETGLEFVGATEPAYRWLFDVMEGAVEADGLPYVVEPVDMHGASDHACFALEGATGVAVNTPVFATQPGDHPYYHTPDDTAEHVTPENLVAAASMMWSTLKVLATGTEDTYTTSARFYGPRPRPRFDEKHRLVRAR
jgi:hypothetical protein